MPRKSYALPNNNGINDISAQRAKLGSNDNGLTPFGEMETHFEIFGMLFDANGRGEIDLGQASQPNGLE